MIKIARTKGKDVDTQTYKQYSQEIEDIVIMDVL